MTICWLAFIYHKGQYTQEDWPSTKRYYLVKKEADLVRKVYEKAKTSFSKFQNMQKIYTVLTFVLYPANADPVRPQSSGSDVSDVQQSSSMVLKHSKMSWPSACATTRSRF